MTIRRASLLLAAACALLPVLPLVANAVDYTTDLVISAQGPSQADRGRTFTYTVFVLNKGPGTAQDVTVTTPLPQGLLFERNGSDTSCSVDLNDNAVKCTFPTLEAGAMRTFNIAFRTAYQDNCNFIEYVIQPSVDNLLTEMFPLTNVSAPSRTSIRCTPVPLQCSDGIDNDRDGLVDMADPGCLSSDQDDEYRDERDRLRGGIRFIPSVSSSSSSSSSVGLPPASPTPQTPSRPLAHGIRVTVQTTRDMVQPGETVPVNILVHNRSDESTDTVTVLFTYDPSQLSVANLGWGIRADNGGVEWTLHLEPNQTRLITLDATVLSSVPAGTSVAASARVEERGDVRVASLVLPVALSLPQTGAGYTGALEDSSRFLTPLSRSGSLGFLMLLAATGVVFGGTVMMKRGVRVR